MFSMHVLKISSADSYNVNELLRSESVNVDPDMEIQMREMRKKSVNLETSADMTRDNQLLTGHNLRIQLQEMLHGHGAIFSLYKNKDATKDALRLRSSRNIIELDEGSGFKVAIEHDGAGHG